MVLGALAACACASALGSGDPTLHADRHCYLVGTPVKVTGAGFSAARTFVVSIDGVYFGQASTDASGAFSTSLRPGGLGAGIAQAVDRLTASDGTASAATTFTVTRRAGARLIASGATPSTLRASFEVWGFAPDGSPRPAYVHYVSPAGRVRTTIRVGRTGGQCGHLRSSSRRLFTFSPTLGRWTLQVDTRRAYRPHPSGPVARIGLRIG